MGTRIRSAAAFPECPGESGFTAWVFGAQRVGRNNRLERFDRPSSGDVALGRPRRSDVGVIVNVRHGFRFQLVEPDQGVGGDRRRR